MAGPEDPVINQNAKAHRGAGGLMAGRNRGALV
jgi:hypothetical protein